MLWQTTIKCVKAAEKLRQKALKGVRLQKETQFQIGTWAQVKLLSWAYKWLLWETIKQTSRWAKTWVTSSKWWLSSIGSFAQSYNRKVLKIRVEILGQVVETNIKFLDLLKWRILQKTPDGQLKTLKSHEQTRGDWGFQGLQPSLESIQSPMRLRCFLYLFSNVESSKKEENTGRPWNYLN